MGYYFWTAVLNAVMVIFSALLVLRIPRKRTALRFCFLGFAVFAALWAICYAVWIAMMHTGNPAGALFWVRLEIASTLPVPLFFTEYIFRRTGAKNLVKPLRVLNILAAAVLLCFSWSPFLISGLRAKNIFPYWPETGELFHFYFGWLTGNVLLCIGNLALAVRTCKSDRERKRYLAILIGCLLGFGGGMTNFFLCYDIPVPPYGNGLVAVYIPVIALTSLYVRNRDVGNFVRFLYVHTGIFLIGCLLLLAGWGITQLSLVRPLSMPPYALAAVVLFIMVAMHDTFRRWLLAGKLIRGGDAQTVAVVKELRRQILKIKTVESGATLLGAGLYEGLALKGAGLFLEEVERGNYKCIWAAGGISSLREIEAGDFFVKYLTERHDLVNLENPEEAVQFPIIVTGRMEAIGAKVCVPLFLHESLTGFLVLDSRRSGIELALAELDALSELGETAAIAFRYADMLDQMVESQDSSVRRLVTDAYGQWVEQMNMAVRQPMRKLADEMEQVIKYFRIGVFKESTVEALSEKLYRLAEDSYKTLDKIEKNLPGREEKRPESSEREDN